MKQQEGVWTIPEIKAETGFDFYIIMKDGILMMTNDDQVAKNPNGFPAVKQLPLASITEMSNYVMYGMLDATQISRVAQKAYAKQEGGAPNEVMELEKIFSKVEIRSTQPDNSGFNTNFYVKMRDQDTNALQFMLDNMEKMMTSGSGSSSDGASPGKDYDELEEEEDGVKRL